MTDPMQYDILRYRPSKWWPQKHEGWHKSREYLTCLICLEKFATLLPEYHHSDLQTVTYNCIEIVQVRDFLSQTLTEMMKWNGYNIAIN